VPQLILLITQLYSLIMLARVLMSWVQIDPYSPLARTLYNLTEPVLAPIRNLLPPMAGFDFSPVIAMVAIQILGGLLAQLFAQSGF
jgi:YggT family protein